MKRIKTSEIMPNIFAIPNRDVNFYLVKGNRGYIAIDTGVYEKASLRKLGILNIKADDVSAVFLTHTDSDHIGGIGLFHHAKVYISKPEEQMIDGSTKRATFLKKNELRCPYETLNDGDTVYAEDVRVTCIITPGHTKGSACYIIDNKYLFSGDCFSLKDGEVKPFIWFFNMDGEEQKRSITKLSDLKNIEAAFTGHHGYTNDFSGAIEGWR